MAPNTQDQLRHVAQAWDKTWTARELDALMALYTSDCYFEAPNVMLLDGIRPGVLEGREAVKKHFARVFELLGPVSSSKPDRKADSSYASASLSCLASQVRPACFCYRACTWTLGAFWHAVVYDGAVA